MIPIKNIKPEFRDRVIISQIKSILNVESSELAVDLIQGFINDFQISTQPSKLNINEFVSVDANDIEYAHILVHNNRLQLRLHYSPTQYLVVENRGDITSLIPDLVRCGIKVMV